MGVEEEGPRMYEGPAHGWVMPRPGDRLGLALLAVAVFVVAVELAFVAVEWTLYGFIFPATARALGVVGLLLLVAANVKTLALALRRQAGEALAGLVDVALSRLWRAHFWLNPLALFSLGLFFMCAPPGQPPFYHIAYGVLLWQAASGLAARESIPRLRDGPAAGRAARAAHHQPAVYVLVAVLVLAGFVDSLFI